MEASRVKIVYNINERDGRTFWNRIGVAFVNRDGSMNVRLDSLPVNGEMHVRDYVPREDTSHRDLVPSTDRRDEIAGVDPAALGMRSADALGTQAA